MISFPRRERAQTAAAVVGVDAGKFSHTLVIRPRGQPDSRPFSFPTTRQGFEAAVAFLREQAPGAALSTILVGIEFAGNDGFTFALLLSIPKVAPVTAVVAVMRSGLRSVYSVARGGSLRRSRRSGGSGAATV